MKTSFFTSALACSFLLFTANSCKKHKQNVQSELSKLPPETQVGANTFGCLINGQAFLPKGSGFSGPVLTCFYVYDSFGNKWYNLGLTASDKSNTSDVIGIGVGTDSLQVNSGAHNLIEMADGNYFGLYIRDAYPAINQYYTNSSDPGTITITSFDEQNQIISGTFHFNVVTQTNDMLKITEGRFDMHYTK